MLRFIIILWHFDYVGLTFLGLLNTVASFTDINNVASLTRGWYYSKILLITTFLLSFCIRPALFV